jgi:Flp pilus assembly CpaE family ATPase
MTLAMNQGSPVVESDPKSPAARAIAGFATKFLPAPVESGRKLGRRSK